MTVATGKMLNAGFATYKDSWVSEFSARIQGELPAVATNQVRDYL